MEIQVTVWYWFNDAYRNIAGSSTAESMTIHFAIGNQVSSVSNVTRLQVQLLGFHLSI